MRKFQGRTFFLAVMCIFSLIFTGCAEENNKEEVQIPDMDHITIMHVDAGKKEFAEYISQAQKDLNMQITVLEYPLNADSRQARVSSLLAAGDASVDVFSINDEMISEYKYTGQLEPLQEDVMHRQVAAAFTDDYFKQVVMAD